MARTIGDEQLQLKKRARRRLIGAIAVVTLMVVLLPPFLDVEPRPVSQNISLQIPTQNGAGFASRVIPVPEKSGSAEAAVRPQPTETVVAPPPASKPSIGKETAKTEQGKNEQSVTSSEHKSPGYAVQLATFAHKENAKLLQKKLSANGIRSYTEVLKSGHGEKIRVRAGPYDNQDDAEKALDQIKALGLNGVVTPK